MTIWDLGGRPAIRKYWKIHYGGKSGVIFVLDVTDQQRIEGAQK